MGDLWIDLAHDFCQSKITSRIMSSSSCVLIKLDVESEVVWNAGIRWELDEGGEEEEEELFEGKRKACGRGEEYPLSPEVDPGVHGELGHGGKPPGRWTTSCC